MSTQPLPPEANDERGLLQSWTRFWFSSVPPTSLHVVRVLAGILILVWLTGFIHQQIAFFSLQGWLDSQAYKEAVANPEGIPMPLTWSVLYSIGNNPTLVHAFYWSSWTVVLLFTLGIAVRLTGLLTWVAVASFLCNPVIDFGGDHLILILSFYLMVGYLLHGLYREGTSWWSRILGPRDACALSPWLPGKHPSEQPTSYAANLALRLIQVHFAIIIVTSGLYKLQFGDWWSGMAFYFPLHPPFDTTDQQLRNWINNGRQNMFFASAAVYAMLAWQIAFPLFAWRKRLRWLLLGGAVLGWLGCVLIYDTPIFGPVYCVVAIAFVTPEEWRALGDRLSGLFSKDAKQRTTRRMGQQQSSELVAKP